eukprot:935443_1
MLSKKKNFKSKRMSTTAILFDDIKDIETETELFVYAYIRGFQSLFPSIDAYFNIPQLIYYMILSFHGASLSVSLVLTKPEISTLLSLLQQSGKGLSDKRWSLLYRGSRDGFTA